MKIIPLDSPSLAVGDIKAASTFKDTKGNVYMKTNPIRTANGVAINCVNLRTGNQSYFADEHLVEEIFLRGVEMQDAD